MCLTKRHILIIFKVGWLKYLKTRIIKYKITLQFTKVTIVYFSLSGKFICTPMSQHGGGNFVCFYIYLEVDAVLALVTLH